MTSGAAFVDLRQDGGAANGHHAAVIKMLGHRGFNVQLCAAHFHGREEVAIGKLRETLGLAGNADMIFDVVVPWLDVFIANRPIDGETVF